MFLASDNMGAGRPANRLGILKHLGIEAVVATSFAGIFYRNAINLGLPVFVLPSNLTDVPQLKTERKCRLISINQCLSSLILIWIELGAPFFFAT